eukprot:TRINITY_DN20584_c0_g3_i1.p1 TRINITY_DN20584_c0_g3~~TRINITY_DN20584_c0_g3_i1.p1  ORF type:complete len:591 (+),score=56.06 TRINITY_DN20584_c0_g3_i1:22-1773(+)
MFRPFLPSSSTSAMRKRFTDSKPERSHFLERPNGCASMHMLAFAFICQHVPFIFGLRMYEDSVVLTDNRTLLAAELSSQLQTSASMHSPEVSVRDLLADHEILKRWAPFLKSGNAEVIDSLVYGVNVVCSPSASPGSEDVVVTIIKENIDNELKMRSELGTHANILPLYDAASDERSGALMMPRAQGGSLQQMFKDKPYFETEWPQVMSDQFRSHVAKIALDISKGLQFLHVQGYNHRNLKPENILASQKSCLPTTLAAAQECVYMLSDFRLVVPTSPQEELGCSDTPTLMPPEIRCRNKSFTKRQNHVIAWRLRESKHHEMVKATGWSHSGDLYSMALSIMSAILRIPPEGVFLEYDDIEVDDGNGKLEQITTVSEISVIDFDNAVLIDLQKFGDGENIQMALLASGRSDCAYLYHQLFSKIGPSMNGSHVVEMCEYLENWALKQIAASSNTTASHLWVRGARVYSGSPIKVPFFDWLGNDLTTFFRRTLALLPADRLHVGDLLKVVKKVNPHEEIVMQQVVFKPPRCIRSCKETCKHVCGCDRFKDSEDIQCMPQAGYHFALNCYHKNEDMWSRYNPIRLG